MIGDTVLKVGSSGLDAAGSQVERRAGINADVIRPGSRRAVATALPQNGMQVR
jgi:hypothetical protein